MVEKGNSGSSFSFGKSGSDSNRGNEKSSGSGEGNTGTITGYVDPEIARATAGTDNGASPGNPASDAPGSTIDAPGTEKRGRGRPRKDGLPPGSGATSAPKPEKARSLNVNGIEKILFSIHAMGASLLQIPELEISEAEAKKVSDAIAGVSDHYKVILDPKKAAWIDLGTVLAQVYGTRAVAIYVRKSSEKPMKFTRPAPVATQQPKPNGRADHVPEGDLAQHINGKFEEGNPGEMVKQPLGKMPEGFDPSKIKLN